MKFGLDAADERLPLPVLDDQLNMHATGLGLAFPARAGHLGGCSDRFVEICHALRPVIALSDEVLKPFDGPGGVHGGFHDDVQILENGGVNIFLHHIPFQKFGDPVDDPEGVVEIVRDSR